MSLCFRRPGRQCSIWRTASRLRQIFFDKASYETAKMVELGLYLSGALQLQVERLSNLRKLIRDDGKHFGPFHRRTARTRPTYLAASTSLAASAGPSAPAGGGGLGRP